MGCGWAPVHGSPRSSTIAPSLGSERLCRLGDLKLWAAQAAASPSRSGGATPSTGPAGRACPTSRQDQRRPASPDNAGPPLRWPRHLHTVVLAGQRDHTGTRATASAFVGPQRSDDRDQSCTLRQDRRCCRRARRAQSGHVTSPVLLVSCPGRAAEGEALAPRVLVRRRLKGSGHWHRAGRSLARQRRRRRSLLAPSAWLGASHDPRDPGARTAVVLGVPF